MLEVREAVQQSLIRFTELFPQQMQKDLRLEEVDSRSEKGKREWLITLSYRNPDIEDEIRVKRSDPAVNALLGSRVADISPRHFKQVILDAEDGSLVGIKSA